MACEAEKKKLEDALQKLKDFRALRSASGFSEMALQLAWLVKYGTSGTSIFAIQNEIDEAQTQLGLCMGVDILSDVPIVGKVLASLASYLK